MIKVFKLDMSLQNSSVLYRSPLTVLYISLEIVKSESTINVSTPALPREYGISTAFSEMVSVFKAALPLNAFFPILITFFGTT